MKQGIRGFRLTVLGLATVVLGTAAAKSGSDTGMVPEVAIASEGMGALSASPTRLKSPDELTDSERERFERVLEMRTQGAPGKSTFASENNWWGDEIPYGCDRPFIMDFGSSYWTNIDDGHWATSEGATYLNFWSCFVPQYNASTTNDTIPHSYYWSEQAQDYIPHSGSFKHPSDTNFSMQLHLMRGDTLMGSCSGNVFDCGHGNIYLSAYGPITCEESLIVVLWDVRQYGGLAFGCEIFEDVPLDEYEACS